MAVEDAARPVLLLERRVLRVVLALRFLLGVQVVEVSVELVETVHRRQELVPIAEMVLAELTGDVAERPQQIGDRRIFRLKAEIGAGQPDLGETGTDRGLSGDERGPACGAALLAVPVREHRPLLRQAIDVRGAVPHDAVVVGADVEPADVVAPDDQDVRFLGCHVLRAKPGPPARDFQRSIVPRIAGGRARGRMSRTGLGHGVRTMPQFRTTRTEKSSASRASCPRRPSRVLVLRRALARVDRCAIRGRRPTRARRRYGARPGPSPARVQR